MAIDIGRCRWELHQRILFVAHPRQPGLFDAISALVEFERLDAVITDHEQAGTTCMYEHSAGNGCIWWTQAEAALVKIVTAVLSP